MKTLTWLSWALISIALAAYFAHTVFLKEDKSELLIGESTHGHYQIELACSSCHTEPFGGTEILQNACLNCHEQELKEAFDSHPKKKFTDPRNADLIDILDARYCVSCHTEHQEEQTSDMGLTIPEDYCYHCHEDIGKERESHKDLPFDSCASAGCHNYHDNRALYEAFLVENAGKPWVLEVAKLANSNHAKLNATPKNPIFEIPKTLSEKHPDITAHWHDDAHSTSGVSCINCHSDDQNNWIENPGLTQCQSCHKKEAEGFLSGKHGMRLAESVSTEIELNAISPKEARLRFHTQSNTSEHSCTSCHSAHTFDRKQAAVDSCLNCHADEHSLAYKNSAHANLWEEEHNGKAKSNTGVSCATCHMPRVSEKNGNTTLVHVEHNQNMNLRPNEKMIRPVCMQCHSLEFSIDALADEDLIKNNFSGKPEKHVESVDWALKREKR